MIQSEPRSASQAELIVALGALVVFLTEAFPIFGYYGFSDIIWAAAILALATVGLRRFLPPAWAANSGSVLVAATIVAVVLALRDVFLDIRFIAGATVDITYVMGMAGLYVGVLIMAFGAWEVWQSRPAGD
jgi:hypothetical protein